MPIQRSQSILAGPPGGPGGVSGGGSTGGGGPSPSPVAGSGCTPAGGAPEEGSKGLTPGTVGSRAVGVAAGDSGGAETGAGGTWAGAAAGASARGPSFGSPILSAARSSDTSRSRSLIRLRRAELRLPSSKVSSEIRLRLYWVRPLARLRLMPKAAANPTMSRNRKNGVSTSFR